MYFIVVCYFLERVMIVDIIKVMGLIMEEVDDYMFIDVNFWVG